MIFVYTGCGSLVYITSIYTYNTCKVPITITEW